MTLFTSTIAPRWEVSSTFLLESGLDPSSGSVASNDWLYEFYDSCKRIAWRWPDRREGDNQSTSRWKILEQYTQLKDLHIILDGEENERSMLQSRPLGVGDLIEMGGCSEQYWPLSEVGAYMDFEIDNYQHRRSQSLPRLSVTMMEIKGMKMQPLRVWRSTYGRSRNFADPSPQPLVKFSYDDSDDEYHQRIAMLSASEPQGFGLPQQRNASNTSGAQIHGNSTVGPNLRHFTKFPDFPPEIHLRIWKYAASNPRIITFFIIHSPSRLGIQSCARDVSCQ
jgi:hypothetical protein